VRPEARPKLSAFCQQLTTIQESGVDEGPVFVDAYQELLDWVGDDGALATMVSWSAYDQQLFERQCAEADIEEHPRWDHVDLKAEFGRWMFTQYGERARFRLAEALVRARVPIDGQAHRAIDDARNTAALLRRIRRPSATSPLTRHALRVLRDRDPAPCNSSHLRGVIPDPKRWFARIRHELVRMQLADDLGQGRGLRLTHYGRSILGQLDLDHLPEAVDPERPVG